MARILSISGEVRTPLCAGWELALAPAGAWKNPSDADGAGAWLPATVPGTVAQTLEKAGQFDRHHPESLHDRDVWYRARLPGSGCRTLCFEGLATLCDIWLDGRRIGTSESMFVPLALEIETAELATVHLHFKAFSAENLPSQGKRQRWRPHLVADSYMRQVRSTLLGHMPGWCPDIDAVGPFRPVTLVRAGAVTAREASLKAGLDGSSGILECSIEINGISEIPKITCAGASTPMQLDPAGRWQAVLRIPDVPRWWPHTHGEPHLHAVTIQAGDVTIDLGKTGFRAISRDFGAKGEEFALIVNGERIFCRGANWTNCDLVSLPGDRDSYRPLLELARDAGMNMLRISGIMAPESAAFRDLLDEYGIMLWQDMFLANFDYQFELESHGTLLPAPCKVEFTRFLDESQASPSLAVVCGGSEIAQQAAMLSLPRERWTIPFLEVTLPAMVAEWRPDVIAMPHTPWGGDQPFHANSGVSHYYGVGAYCRPLDDARRAEVKFATECLAFATLPQPAAMARDHVGLDPAGPEWKACVVRDLKAAWDFEDSRDYYLDLLYGVSAAALKLRDPARYITLSQAVPGEVMEATYAEWRRKGSGTAGALVWFLSDLGRGFGWGVIDWRGEPKPAYYALKRAFRPVQVLLTDEGLNGVAVHVINESAEPRALNVSLACHAADGSVVIEGTLDLELQPRETRRINQTDFFSVFFDASAAYRFGPPAHEAVVASLREQGTEIASAFLFPLGRGVPTQELRRSMAGLGVVLADEQDFRRDLGLTATLQRDAAGWFLRLTTRLLAQSVHVDCSGWRVEDDWFHLAPGAEKVVRLRGAAAGQPTGEVRALNGMAGVGF